MNLKFTLTLVTALFLNLTTVHADSFCVSFYSQKTSFIAGVFDDISHDNDVALKSGKHIQFVDSVNRQRTHIEIKVDGDGWRGLLEMSREDNNISLDVISLEGKTVPRTIDPVAQTVLLRGRGVPTSSYLTLRGMKLLGVDYAETFTMSKVRHAETLVTIARGLKEKAKKSPNGLITVADFLELYRKEALHRLSVTVIEQAGFKIKAMKLIPNSYANQALPPSALLRTNYSPKAKYEVRVPADPNKPHGAVYLHSEYYDWAKGTHELGFYSLLFAANMRHPYIDKKALQAHVEMLEKKNSDIDKFAMDFSVVYEIE